MLVMTLQGQTPKLQSSSLTVWQKRQPWLLILWCQEYEKYLRNLKDLAGVWVAAHTSSS